MRFKKGEYIFDEFCKMCPWTNGHVISWRLVDDDQIIIKLDDYSFMKYDYVNGTFAIAKTEEDFYKKPTNEDEWRMELAKRLYRKMMIKGYTQEDVAWMTQISQSSITKYMNGLSTPSSYNLCKLAEVLECSVSDLTDFSK